MLLGPKAQTIDVLCARIYAHKFYGICFTQMSMFSIHFLFIFLFIATKEWNIFYSFIALASMIFYSGRCLIVCNVFVSDIFDMFYLS